MAKVRIFCNFVPMEVQELQFGHRRVCLYRLVEGAAPLIYSIDYHENGQLLIAACREVGCSGFNLVTISGLHWNQELSPWPVETVISKNDNFAGGAPEWLQLLTCEVVPQVEALLDAAPSWRMLAGYSMAGLFAVWTAFQTDLFTRILSASGSLNSTPVTISRIRPCVSPRVSTGCSKPDKENYRCYSSYSSYSSYRYYRYYSDYRNYHEKN